MSTLESSQQSFVYLLRASQEAYSDLSSLLKNHGISEPQFNVLRILRGAGEQGLQCQAIAARMITRVPDVTRLLDRLESRGLVRRERSRSDRRVVDVFIQQRGLELLEQLDSPVARLHREQFSALSEEEQGQLIRLLSKLL